MKRRHRTVPGPLRGSGPFIPVIMVPTGKGERAMAKNRVLLLFVVLLLIRGLRRNPMLALLGALLSNRGTRRLAAGLLFGLLKNRRARRLVFRRVLRR
jgi:hypothetical protein